MADRGELIVMAGTEEYGGMVVGEQNRSVDMNVNIVQEKKLTNMRSSTSHQTVILLPARPMPLNQCIEFIPEDELVEVTPDGPLPGGEVRVTCPTEGSNDPEKTSDSR